ncbi:MAG: adenylate/guanylate cyclase domain-containing protein [Verrucomicrobia bacterium]|nr:adenylate/guanylate cyclase domain-containing protein [Verrucomicrobiota bacterium]
MITLAVLAIVCFIRSLPSLVANSGESGQSRFDFAARLEWMTYDARVRWALRFPRSHATNLLGAVFIGDKDLREMNDGSYGYRVKFPWPRYFYGRVVNELAAQGAKAVALDILFDEIDLGAEVKTPIGKSVLSDPYFADELRSAGNVVLATHPMGEIFPAAVFETNALAVGNVYTKVDADGILRQAKAFVEYRKWHPAIRRMARALEWDFRRLRIETNRIVCPRTDGKSEDFISLRTDGSLKFDQEGELVVNQMEASNASQATDSAASKAQKPYEEVRVWQLGIVLAARQLGLDLDQPIIQDDRIVLRAPGGIERIIPVDKAGFFYVDWAIKLNDPERLAYASAVRLIRQSEAREEGQSGFEPKFRGRLVVVGSIGTGGNVSDRGATPLENETVLISKHWNVANSVLTGRFISRASSGVELGLILLFGLISAVLTWNLRVILTSVSVLVIAILYVGSAFGIYLQDRYWLPIFLPVAGGLLLPHVSLITYRVIFEERERRRVRAVFSRIVAPDIVNELLNAEKLSLGGARRDLTVLFADVRGFTEFTDVTQANAEEFIRQRGLRGKEAENHYDEQAREVLNTVSLYLGVVADTVKKHQGTLDKYIGDCVMAFWGAPAPNDAHAVYCVRAAIEAQRAIYAINQQRFADNKRREQENIQRAASSVGLLPMFPLLSVGCGINTGKMTVGLMGSNADILNYTVFGREVNLASRLQGVAGRGVIIISEATFAEIRRHDPVLAATLLERPPVQVKGIRQPVKVFEVPWKQDTGSPRPSQPGAPPRAA